MTRNEAIQHVLNLNKTIEDNESGKTFVYVEKTRYGFFIIPNSYTETYNNLSDKDKYRIFAISTDADEIAKKQKRNFTDVFNELTAKANI